MTARTDKGTLGYEQARDELIDVVRRLEAGGTTLEESLALWERGEELAKVCRRWLDGARARLDAALTERDEPGGQGAPGAARTTADSGSGSDSGGVSGDVGGGETGPGR